MSLSRLTDGVANVTSEQWDYLLERCRKIMSEPYYDGPATMAQCDSSAKMAMTPTLKQRLEGAVNRAEEQLAAAKEARELFDRNPDIEKLLNLMQRGLF